MTQISPPSNRIPTSALALGLAGLIPFVWSALTQLSPTLADWTLNTLGARFVGPYMGLNYGTIILSFMSGVLWGFATRANTAQAAMGYALSVVPALWAFFMIGSGPTSSAFNLIFGFLGVLALDVAFWSWGLAPRWWLGLRIGLTACVVLCLAVTVI